MTEAGGTTAAGAFRASPAPTVVSKTQARTRPATNGGALSPLDQNARRGFGTSPGLKASPMSGASPRAPDSARAAHLDSVKLQLHPGPAPGARAGADATELSPRASKTGPPPSKPAPVATRIKMTPPDLLAGVDERVQARIHELEVALINAVEDNCEYRSEYERILEEGKLLHTTYASKVNQLKQLAGQNVRLQAEMAAVRDREQLMARELDAERAEQVRWKGKLKEQTERFGDVFRSLEKMKEQAAEDAATIKRLQASAKGGAAMSTSFSHQQQHNMSTIANKSVSGTDGADVERRHKAQVAALEQRVEELRARLERKTSAAVTGPVAAMGAAELREKLEALAASNELLREDNKSLLLEVARAGEGKYGQQAKLEQKESEAARLRTELNSASERARQLDERAAASDAAQQRLLAEVARLQTEAAACDALRAELVGVRAQLNDIQAQDYGRRLAAVVAERESWRARAAQLEQLLNVALETDAGHRMAGAQLKQLVERVAREAATVAAQRAELAAMREGLDARVAALGSMEDRARDYAEHVERVEHRCTSLARSVGDAEAQATAALQQAQDARAAEATMRAQLEAVQAQRASLAAEVEEQRCVCRELEECARETEEFTSSLQQRLVAAEQERDAAKAAEACVRAELADLGTALARLAEERDELKTLSAQLFEASQGSQADMEEREAEVLQLREQLEALQHALGRQQSASKDLSAALDRKMDEFQRAVAAKQEECVALRKLLDDARKAAEDRSGDVDAERARRVGLEAQLREAEVALDAEHSSAKTLAEQLASTAADLAATRTLVELASNEREQLELIQESLLEVLEGRNSCCCAEARELAVAVRQSGIAAESKTNQLRDVAKLQAVVDQQNRYITEAKASSNAKIRLLHSQLTTANEKVGALLRRHMSAADGGANE